MIPGTHCVCACVEIRSINSRLWFMAVSWLWCPRRMTTSASIAEGEESEAGKGGKVGYEIQAWLYPHALRIRPPPPHWLLPFRFTDYRACRMHLECIANAPLLIWTHARFAIIFIAHTKSENMPKTKEITPGRQGVASYGGFIASLPQLMRYNYIYVYGSTQYINIFIAL